MSSEIPATEIWDGETFGQVGAMWLLANEQPLTVNEMCEIQHTSRDNCSKVLKALYRKGVLVRRKRNLGMSGGYEYEYAIAEYDGRWTDE